MYVEATRAYKDACERAFSAVMGINVSINGHVSCLLMYEQFYSNAEINYHLSWMCMRRDVSLCICEVIQDIKGPISIIYKYNF